MGFSSEETLLLECLRAERDPEAHRKFRWMAGRPLDWQRVLRTAVRNHIAALIYDRLRTLDGGTVPPGTMRAFEQEYHRVGFRNARNYAELGQLLRSLKDRGVEVIVLKGAALAETVWKNIALRPMADMDLLVRQDDLIEAERTLLSNGYAPDRGVPPPGGSWDQYYHLPPFCKSDPRITVEIHHNIVHPRRVYPLDFDVGQFWARACVAQIAGVETHILAPEDTILHLCLHQCKHDPFVGKIKNLMDVAKVIGFYGECLRWDMILTEARRTGTGKFVYYTLLFAEIALGARIEPEVGRRLRTQFALLPFEDSLVRAVITRNLLLRDESASVLPTWLLVPISYELLRQGASRDRLCSVLKLLFLPPVESPADSSPRSLSTKAIALFWLGRLGRVSQKFRRRIVGRLESSSQRSGVYDRSSRG
jgi:hypothetical protein